MSAKQNHCRSGILYCETGNLHHAIRETSNFLHGGFKQSIPTQDYRRSKPHICFLLASILGNSLSVSEDSLCNGLWFLTFRGLIQSFWTSFNWWWFRVCPCCVPSEHALAGVLQAWSQDSNTSALYKKILAANYQPPSFISESVKDLISGLLTVDPAKRCLPKNDKLFCSPVGWCWLDDCFIFICFSFEFRELYCDAFGWLSLVNACLVSWGFTIADVRAHPWYKQAPPRQVKGFTSLSRAWIWSNFDFESDLLNDVTLGPDMLCPKWVQAQNQSKAMRIYLAADICPSHCIHSPIFRVAGTWFITQAKGCGGASRRGAWGICQSLTVRVNQPTIEIHTHTLFAYCCIFIWVLILWIHMEYIYNVHRTAITW